MKILFDSDFLIALRFPDQSNFLHSKQILKRYKSKYQIEVFCLNLCLYETATVISKKYGQRESKEFYQQTYENLPTIINIDSTLEKITWQIFLSQIKKNISFIDCANLAAVKLYNLDKIFSYDKFYPKELRLS